MKIVNKRQKLVTGFLFILLFPAFGQAFSAWPRAVGTIPGDTEREATPMLLEALKKVEGKVKVSCEESDFIVVVNSVDDIAVKRGSGNYLPLTDDAIAGAASICILLVGNVFESATLQYTEEQTAFARSFWDFSHAMMGLLAEKGRVESEIPFKLAVLSPVSAPGRVIVSVNGDEAIQIVNHEKNWLLLRVGVAGRQVRLQGFSIKDGKLSVDPSNDAEKKDWKSNFIVFVDLHWPRDPDDYATPMYGKWDHFFSNLDGLEHLAKRFAIVGGINISSSPADALYLGGSLSLSEEVGVSVGAVWNRVYKEGEITKIGDITSFDAVADYGLKRTYDRAKLFAAITFAPGVFAKKIK